jgi:hypothetical protein
LINHRLPIPAVACMILVIPGPSNDYRWSDGRCLMLSK